MAIDTENKRASATNLFLFQVPPAPDGAVSAADRSHLDVYAGIATSVLDLAVGFVTMICTARLPGITPTARQPGIAYTARMPHITFTAS